MRQNSIPKIIHYCWFGRNELTPLAEKCIQSWKKYLPDYKIVEWNEDNFDIKSNKYVRQAYEAGKWAFVTDYVRLYVIYNYGGIYMDTDVEVVKNLDCFLNHKAFTGFEEDESPITGILASRSKNTWIRALLADYDNRSFINKDGTFDLTTNVITISKITQNMYPIKLDNSLQSFNDVTFYPFEYFCAKDLNMGKIKRTLNTYTIHHFSGSWLSSSQRKKIFLKRIIGIDNMKRLSKIKQILIRRKK